MGNIVIYGSKYDNVINDILVNAILNYANVFYNEELLQSKSANNSGIVYNVESKENIDNSKNGGNIIVFKNSFEATHGIGLSNGNIVIIDSQNTQAVKVLSGTDNIVITCGMSMRDTLSVSSFELSEATVSLQREVQNLNFDAIEPREFKVALANDIGVYPILSCCAVLLMLGMPTDDGYTL